MANLPVIPSSRVDLIDSRTGMIAREWFLYLSKLQAAATTVSDDALVGPDTSNVVDQITELRKSIQDVELSIGSNFDSTTQTIDLGYLNVTDFGVNGTASDPANIAIAIAAAITQKKRLYVPQMTVNMGTTTMVFPETVPVGFTFDCDPGSIILYTGTGDAVTINSAGFCSYTFGGFYGYGGATAIRINPANPNANLGGQTAVVACEIVFNTIVGFYCGVHADNGVVNVAQNNIRGVAIIGGQGGVAPGSMNGYVTGILATGRVGGVYQGNMWNVNYIESDPPSFSAGVTWIGIQDGDATMADTNNVNTYQYGAIDAITYSPSYGVNSYGNRNIFIGDIVDIDICFQVATTGYFLYIFAGALSTFGAPGNYQIFDNSAHAGWHWSWLGASDGRTGPLVAGVPNPRSPPTIVTNPTALPATGAAIVIIPMGAVALYGDGLSIVGGGVQVAKAGIYSIKAGALVTCGVASVIRMGVGINGVVNIVAAASDSGAIQSALSCSCDVALAANDIIYIGAQSSTAGIVTAAGFNTLSVTGPLQG